MADMIQVDKDKVQRILRLARGVNSDLDTDLRGDGSVTAGRRLERIANVCGKILNDATATPDVDQPDAD